MDFSIIIPAYRCDVFLKELSERLVNTLIKITDKFELIFVNDSSPANDWSVICEICKSDKRIKGINLSRNFGQHYAITAGLEHASGEWIVVMDADLQDIPEEIPELFQKAREGYDIVFAQRIEREDSFLKRMSSKIFYKVFSYLTDTKQDSSIANFGIYHKNTIAAMLSMKDSIKYFPTMMQWVGFKKTKIEVRHGRRTSGKSSYSLSALLKLASNNIVAFSNKPLKLVVKLGFVIVIVSILIAAFYITKWFMGDIVIMGYSSLIVSLWLLSGIHISILGMVGIYIGKIFERTKDRPIYIVKEKINHD